MCFPQSPFSGFSWHPKNENLIVAVAKNGRLSAVSEIVTSSQTIICQTDVSSQVEVTERIAPSWSSEHCLMWPHQGRLTSFSPEVTQLFNEVKDVSVTMQARVALGYGAMDPLWRNAEVVQDSQPSVATAWNWMHHCGKLMKEDLSFRNAFSKHAKYPGT